MKSKYLLILPILLVMTFGVLAQDFNSKASMFQINPEYNVTAKFSSWHEDARLPTYNPYRWFNHAEGTRDHYSNGVPANGKGTLMYDVVIGKTRVSSLNMNFEETGIVYQNANEIKLAISGTSVIWNKGYIPEKQDIQLYYVYNFINKNVKIYDNQNNLVLTLY